MDEVRFTIPLPPRTKKNSQRIVRIGGRYSIMPSKAYKEYERDAAPFIPRLPPMRGLNVRMAFFMPTRRRVDLVNLQEACLDVMVKHGALEDDNCLVVAGMDGSGVGYDKENPRTEVTITKKEGQG